MATVFERPKFLTDTPFHYCPGCTPVSYTHLDVYKRQRTALPLPAD